MINLEKVRAKIESALNSNSNPTGYTYLVEASGFHADGAYSQAKGENAIRVFIASMGGQFNPVPDLGESTYSVPITLYFPVRLKRDMFVLDQYLHSLFVGRKVNFGTDDDPDEAVCNLSGATYGEIQELDFREFKQWADNLFRKPIEVHEPYISMQVSLYLSSLGEGYAYGNDATATLAWGSYSMPLVFADGAIQSSSASVSDQAVGGAEALGLPYGVGFGMSFRAYLSDSKACKNLLSLWLGNSLASTSFTLSISIPKLGVSYSKGVYITSFMLPLTKGSPLAATIGFAVRR